MTTTYRAIDNLGADFATIELDDAGRIVRVESPFPSVEADVAEFQAEGWSGMKILTRYFAAGYSEVGRAG
jgi:hypothetical protein